MITKEEYLEFIQDRNRMRKDVSESFFLYKEGHSLILRKAVKRRDGKTIKWDYIGSILKKESIYRAVPFTPTKGDANPDHTDQDPISCIKWLMIIYKLGKV